MTAAVLVAADTPEPDGPPGQPYISPDDLASIQPLWDEAVDEHLMPLVAEVWDDSAGMIHAEMLDATDVDFPFPSVGSVTAEEYLAQARNVYSFIGDDLWQTARAQLAEGFAAGESIPQLADRLRGSAGLTARRATLVARSSVIEASNAGSIATARASGIEMQKEWIATPDERTRPTHHTADGQKVPLADPFTVGGFSADVPGDPGLPPQEKYNCRCTTGFVMTDAVAKQATRNARPEPPLPGTSGVTDNRITANPNPILAEVPPAPAQDRAATRKAARARQKAIADVEPAARFAAEIDNIANARRGLPFNAEARKILTQRLAQAEADGIPAADLAAVRAAVDARDLARVRAEAQTYANSRGLSPIGSAGERLPFDPASMQTVDGAAAIGDGDLVEVIRQGHVLTLTGEEIQLDRAVVSGVVDSGTAATQDLSYAARQDAVRRLGDRAPTESRRMGGEMANTSLLSYTDDKKLIEKIYNRTNGTAAEVKHEVDAEQLGAKVLDALGLRSPAIIVTGRDRLLIEYIDGELGAELVSWEGAIESDAGRLLGLADVLMANGDRNGGNWLLAGDELAGIDHGEAFYNQLVRNDFTTHLTEFGTVFGQADWLDTIDFSREDLALVRERLTALRPDFVALKRTSWFNQMMARLAEAEKRATDTRNRIPR